VAFSRLLVRSSLRHLASHPWQFALSIVGVAVGVAVVVAIDLANVSAETSFRKSSETVAGRATHRILGASTSGLPDSVLAHLVREGPYRGIDVPMTPVVEGWVRPSRATERTLQVLGVDPLLEAAFRPYASDIGRQEFGLDDFLGGRPVALMSTGTASDLGLAVADTFRVEASGVAHVLKLAGTIEGADNLVVLDVSTAQRILGLERRISRIDLILPDADGNASGADVAARIRDVLPPGAVLERSSARTETLAQMTRAFSLNLTALSLLALIVGMFLTYNTMSFSVVQRYGLIGRLRAVGVRRREVLGMILAEALVVGVLGTAAGLVLGVVLGQGLVALVTQTINDLYYSLSVSRLAIGPMTLAKGIGLGVGATLLAAWMPARAAAGVTATSLLQRSSVEDRLRGRLPMLTGMGAALLVGGGALLWASGRGIVVAYAGIFMLIVGWALLAPALTAVMVAVLRPLASRFGGVTGRMAAGSVRAHLSRTAVAIAALSIAISSVLGVGIMVGSFRTTVVTWLEGALQADIYVQAPGRGFRSGGTGIRMDALAALRETAGRDQSFAIRHAEVLWRGTPVHVAAVEFGPHSEGALAMKRGRAADVLPRLRSERAVLISEPFAYRHGAAPGDTLHLLSPGGELPLEVVGIYHDYASDQGTVMMDRAQYASWFEDDGVSGLAVFVEADAEGSARMEAAIDSVMAIMQQRAGPLQELIIRSNRELRTYSLDVFDRTFTVTQVLQLLAVIVAFIGILSALMALQLERAREYAVLRASGMTGRQLSRFVSWECGLMGFVSGILALPLGGALAMALIFVINKRSFGWTLQVDASPGLFLQGLVVAVVAALLAGILPARALRRQRAADALKGAFVVLVAAGSLFLAGCSTPDRPESEGLSLSDALSGDIEGYARAYDAAREWRFPADHGPHPDYKLEWWYVTGNLVDSTGGEWGYQVTIFRNALAPPRDAPGLRDTDGESTGTASTATASDWATRQLYISHVGLTDDEGQRYASEERVYRGGGGLAGASTDRFHVWAGPVEMVALLPDGPSRAELAQGLDTLRIRAPVRGRILDLTLTAQKPIVFQGENGFSPKSDEPGNASWYYALSRFSAEGTIGRTPMSGQPDVRIGGQPDALPVLGTGWLDREWSTSLLGRTQTGWDWFSLQLDDGRDLMYFQLRERESEAPFVDASLVGEDGVRAGIDARDITLDVLSTWTSPHTGADYPASWRLRHDALGIDLTLEPLLADQEFQASVRYWEGAVRITGSHTGRGYVELTGYE